MRKVASVTLLCVAAAAGLAAPPAIVSVNPAGPPAPQPPAGTLRVTPGKVQVLKLDGVTTPVQWNVVQPIGPGGVRRVIGEAVVVPKGGFVLGWMEGEAKIGVKRFDFETLALVGTGQGSGFVVVQAQIVEGASIKTVAELVVEVVGGNPDPTPDPVKPDPPKPPDPAKTFRVVFVYESEQTLTAGQKSVVYAKSVSDYLNERATKEGDRPGWRRYDQNTAADNEQPTMKALWAAVKPKVTAVPCVAVEVDGKVDIVPLPATPEDAVALFKKYRGE